VAGDTSAWTALQAEIEPLISCMARRHRGLRRKGLADEPDDVAEVRTVVLERLAEDNFRNLRSYVARSNGCASPQSFEGWLYGTVDYAVLDHLRKRFGRAPKRTVAEVGRVQPSKRELQSQAGRLTDEPESEAPRVAGVTTRLTIVQIQTFIEEALTPDETKAVRLYYLEDRSIDEIAAVLGLENAKAADQLIRRLKARLRYRFAPAR